MTTTTITTKKATWREQIMLMVANAQAMVTATEASFTDTSIAHGILFAIQWRAESLAKAKGAMRFFAAVERLIRTADQLQSNDTDLAHKLMEAMDDWRTEALEDVAEGFRSHNPFCDPIQEAEMAGYISALTSKKRDRAYHIRQIIWKADVLKPGEKNFEPASIEEIIEHHKYEDILKEKGWGEMAIAVRKNHPEEIAEAVISWITDEKER